MTFNYGGTSGADYLDYLGNDKLYAVAYAGNDAIFGGNYGDTISGGAGNDKLYGYIGNDVLYGDAGSDVLKGEAGNDYLDGFSGGSSREVDTLTGGTGVDIFVVGDKTGVCYLGGRSGGTDSSYALIKDWNPNADLIQAWGNASLYKLVQGSWLGTSQKDTGVYYKNDLIAVIQDSVNVSLTNDFVFV